MAWRDMKESYKRTAPVAAQAIILPVLTIGYFSLFFDRLAQNPSGRVTQPVVSNTVFAPRSYFAQALG